MFDKLRGENVEASYDVEFNASRGWFGCFKNRFNFHNMKISGKAASADQFGADTFIPKIKINNQRRWVHTETSV